MQQLTFIKSGILEWHDVPAPLLQSSSDAIVHPVAVARCDLDVAIIHGKAPFHGPFAIGHEFIAEVTEFGDAVTSFPVGQKVVVPFQISCGTCPTCLRGLTGSCTTVPPLSMYGLGSRTANWGGALSDYVRVPFAENMLVPVPDGIEASTIASLSDNMVDAWRTVGPYLTERPGSEVLIVGGGAWSVGLYAAAIAIALGASRVDYIDTDRRRLELAESVGAKPIAGVPPRKRLGPYAITVDASVDPDGLACALRSVEPEGVCTSVGIYFSEHTPLPLKEMYFTGVTFKTGRANSRAGIPKVLELIQSGKLNPERLTTRRAKWEEAAEAFKDPSAKVVIARDRL